MLYQDKSGINEGSLKSGLYFQVMKTIRGKMVGKQFVVSQASGNSGL
jgi:hypothetical protein